MYTIDRFCWDIQYSESKGGLKAVRKVVVGCTVLLCTLTLSNEVNPATSPSHHLTHEALFSLEYALTVAEHMWA